jgi:hypothetical protein
MRRVNRIEPSWMVCDDPPDRPYSAIRTTARGGDGAITPFPGWG